MNLSRRDLLGGLSGIAATAAFGAPGAGAAPASPRTANDTFPRRADFTLVDGVTYLANAATHPMPIASMRAYRASVDRRGEVGMPATPASGVARPGALTAFAALINAKPHEVGYVQNTSHGENLVFESLELDRNDTGNVVTDWLHFEGALVHLLERKKQGLDVRIASPRDGRVAIEDLAALVDKRTKLIEVSWIAMYNGFQQDLKAVSDLAHAHGAYVYADIIQGVGAVPLDVKAAGIDFAACATYKWLMGDFGLGFFYCREELLDRIRHPHVSYPAATIEMHSSPFDPRHQARMTYTMRSDTAAFAQTGTTASSIAAALGVSIPYIQTLGVANIQAHRAPLLARLQAELPKRGFTRQTPIDSTSPLVTFAVADTAPIAQKLRDARVSVTVTPHAIRIAPSIYNDMADIDRLIDSL
jgi:selenocysteine lyase/cysteine desulfurase